MFAKSVLITAMLAFCPLVHAETNTYAIESADMLVIIDGGTPCVIDEAAGLAGYEDATLIMKHTGDVLKACAGTMGELGVFIVEHKGENHRFSLPKQFFRPKMLTEG